MHTVSKLKIIQPLQLSWLEAALCYHYGSEDVKGLGHGSVGHILTSLQKRRHAREASIFYEAALTAKAKLVTTLLLEAL